MKSLSAEPARRLAAQRLRWAALVVGLVTVTAHGVPAVAQAQEAKSKIAVVGLLGTSPPSVPAAARLWRELADGLRERGWVEAETLRFEGRWTEGRQERFSELAAELARLDVDLIVAAGSQAARAARDATGTIPIVFVGVSDPIGAGFAASLARPGGSMTGVSSQLGDLTEKTLQNAQEAIPQLKHLAVMWDPNNPGSALAFKQAQERYPASGVRVTSAPLSSPEGIEGALEAVARARPDLLLVHPTPTNSRLRGRIGEFARRARLPTGVGNPAWVIDGTFLMSYGPDSAHLFRRAALHVDKILGGARPGDVPIEQPMRLELVVNRRVARAIGLELPLAFVARADQLID